jgi:hypothetical protein
MNPSVDPHKDVASGLVMSMMCDAMGSTVPHLERWVKRDGRPLGSTLGQSVPALRAQVNPALLVSERVCGRLGRIMEHAVTFFQVRLTDSATCRFDTNS